LEISEKLAPVMEKSQGFSVYIENWYYIGFVEMGVTGFQRSGCCPMDRSSRYALNPVRSGEEVGANVVIATMGWTSSAVALKLM